MTPHPDTPPCLDFDEFSSQSSWESHLLAAPPPHSQTCASLSSSTATPSAPPTATHTDSRDSTRQNLLDHVNASDDLPTQQKADLSTWLWTLNSHQCRVIADQAHKAVLDVIMVAYARDSLSQSTSAPSTGPLSQSPKVSPNPTTAPSPDAPAAAPGADINGPPFPGLIKNLTDAQLLAELHYWQDRLTAAKSWGAVSTAASEFERECSFEIRRRTAAKKATEGSGAPDRTARKPWPDVTWTHIPHSSVWAYDGRPYHGYYQVIQQGSNYYTYFSKTLDNPSLNIGVFPSLDAAKQACTQHLYKEPLR